jgi:hypothetical protein
MKKVLLFSVITVIVMMGYTLSAQQTQVQNPGVEEWEDAGTVIDEPVDWSSLKTSDNETINTVIPQVWDQSTDAHTGNYSIKLYNVATMAEIVATGSITNGRFHTEFDPSAGYVYTDTIDERWHTVCTDRPDSIAVWVKYTPVGMDTAQFKALLHTGWGTLPIKPENQDNEIGFAQINVAGTVDTWTRFVMPFTYYSDENPEYILFIATSGAGLAPVEGSSVLYDDIELIYGSSAINELSANDGMIYVDDNQTLVLDNLPQNYLQDATLELFSLTGANIWSSHVFSNRMQISNTVNSGLYIIKIAGKGGNFSQKLFIK